jgi:hypothetical protein
MYERIISVGTFVAEETTLDPTVSNVTFYQNGLQTSAQTLTGVTSLSSGIALGAASDGSSPWQGDIAEVLVYDHQLSPSELQQVQTYLIDQSRSGQLQLDAIGDDFDDADIGHHPLHDRRNNSERRFADL